MFYCGKIKTRNQAMVFEKLESAEKFRDMLNFLIEDCVFFILREKGRDGESESNQIMTTNCN